MKGNATDEESEIVLNGLVANGVGLESEGAFELYSAAVDGELGAIDKSVDETIVGKSDKAEAAGLARHLVAHDAALSDGAKLRKIGRQAHFVGVRRQTTDKQFATIELLL